MRRLLAAAPLAAALSVAAGAGPAGAQPAPAKSCEEAVRRHETLQGLLALMGRLKNAAPLWSSDRPDTASYVLLIPAPEGERCAVVWHEGAQRSIFPLAAAPRLDTPLYGFHQSSSSTCSHATSSTRPA